MCSATVSLSLYLASAACGAEPRLRVFSFPRLRTWLKCLSLGALQDLLHGRIQMKTLTNKWYEEVRQGPSGSEDDDDEAELL